METTKRIRQTLVALSLLSLAACGQVSSQARTDPTPGLLAMGPTASDSARVDTAPSRPASTAGKIPEDILRDPAERFAFIEQLRTQAVHRTRRVSNDRWWNQVRPALRRQLEDAGLARGGVDFLLSEIDQAKIARR